MTPPLSSPHGGAPRPAPVYGDPSHIRRAEVMAALARLGIIRSTNDVNRVVITPDAIEVTRYVCAEDGHRRVDPLTGDVPTATTRIEID